MIQQFMTMNGEENAFKKFVRSLELNDLGAVTYTGCIDKQVLSDISAICRRAFKRDEVAVYVEIEDRYESYNSGVVFTEKGIFYWTECGDEIESIMYGDIQKVDFNDSEVIIEGSGGEITIDLGDDADENKAPRHMYTFIMDILDYMEEH